MVSPSLRIVPVLGLVAVFTAASIPSARAEETAPAPRVGLDRLLELPAGKEYVVDKRGGRTRSEWRNRFTEVENGLAEAEEALAKAETELEEVAGEHTPWQISALPGVTTADAPLDYRLRQEIRRQRSQIEILKDRRTELAVQADLAGVPPEWRQ